MGSADVSVRNRLADNLASVRQRIADACRRSSQPVEAVTLVAVTKTVSVEVAQTLVELGQLDLGESRPQVLWQKAASVSGPVRWHLVGHLQTNKIRRTVPLVSMIHSIDRLELAEAVSQEAERIGTRVPVTLEINVTGEMTKHGFTPAELAAGYPRLCRLEGLQIIGLMTMARYEDDAEACRPTFVVLRNLRDRLTTEFAPYRRLPVLSMGMSRDFEVAIEEGATHVRVGTALFEGIEC
jgi:pyridoxal phosphate enzyme (YggS family)